MHMDPVNQRRRALFFGLHLINTFPAMSVSMGTAVMALAVVILTYASRGVGKASALCKKRHSLPAPPSSPILVHHKKKKKKKKNPPLHSVDKLSAWEDGVTTGNLKPDRLLIPSARECKTLDD